ncbi:efflux RND transporter periplasmic adaptor subunit [Pseudoalteromonas obscura]|uniref:Efflux RND transporter periplasmic adaptor subunit n=1 Tax=Pseudoalteromonas obscura TaxID=3048491 RepID=A0ABT7EJP6_9GAMM|nr:efflux RND transporter periplasmic adaptor subunit [Pseudoalteromonas sp. P94(2023)]MDK2595286.1 efflux RND transporter periplasmic adaptor subunit [Pseudoalteromonas sp. P94(2023)]
MTLAKRIILPVAILTMSILLVVFITSNPPQAKRGKSKAQAQMVVDFEVIQAKPFAMALDSYGVVKPRTQSVLVAQVSGEISFISNSFRDGGFFEKGELLLQIDDRDYQAEVQVAKAALLGAKQSLLEEQARGKQAQIDWQRLGDGGQAGELVLRKPQLEAQKANVLSAQAKLTKAELALERTRILAPFAGRILNKKVDLGQVVSSNSQLAEIYATDYVEIRLPINNRDLAFMRLPEHYRDSDNHINSLSVTLYSDLVKAQQWQGKIVRTEGAISELSQQLYVVAQIDDPFSVNQQGDFAIKIGQYVNAKIEGKTLENAITIPSSAIYQGSYVYVLDEQNLLMRRDISLAWQNDEFAIVRSGISEGMRLVTTSLGQISSGTPVALRKSKNQGEQGPAFESEQWQQLTEKQKRKLKKMAAERGVSIEQLLAERKRQARETGI